MFACLGVAYGILGGTVVGSLEMYIFCALGLLGAFLSLIWPYPGSLLLVIAAAGITLVVSEVAIGPAPLFAMAALVSVIRPPRTGSLVVLIPAMGITVPFVVFFGAWPLVVLAVFLVLLAWVRPEVEKTSTGLPGRPMNRQGWLVLGLVSVAVVSTAAFLIQLLFMSGPASSRYRENAPFRAPLDVAASTSGNICRTR